MIRRLLCWLGWHRACEHLMDSGYDAVVLEQAYIEARLKWLRYQAELRRRRREEQSE